MIDSHAHVAVQEFNNDLNDVFQRANDAGVEGWVEIGTDLVQSCRAVELATQHDNVWASVGVHPNDISEMTEEVWVEIGRLTQNKKVVAIGEVGLDYHRGGKLEEQLPVLQRFIHLANVRGLPVIFHLRSGAADANNDLLNLLQSLPPAERPRGVAHTFSGTLEQAKQFLELGLYISISGVVTFKNAGMLPEVVRQTPLDHLLIETDSPFLTPEPYRGQRNEPAYVSYVAQKVAELKGISVEEVGRVTAGNTRNLFGLQK